MGVRFWLIALTLLLAGVHPLDQRVRVAPADIQQMTAHRVPLTPAQRRIGPLRVVEAWQLSSPNKRFGSISAMALTGDRRFLMLSDSGQVIRFSLTGGGQVRGFSMTPLPGARTRKNSADAESLWRDPADGRLWVGFEGSNRIARFSPALDRREAARRPRRMAGWSGNGGLEAMTRLQDGRFLALSERSMTRCCGAAGLLFAADPATPAGGPGIPFGYRDWGMGRLTDAATLPDGRVLLLHRTVELPLRFTSTLAVADPASIAWAHRWTARPLAALLDGPLTENYEAMAILPQADGLTIWLASDDNFSSLQRSLLLRLWLPAQALPPR